MRIGEIIETGTAGFVAESFELNRPPPLGSLVKVCLLYTSPSPRD